MNRAAAVLERLEPVAIEAGKRSGEIETARRLPRDLVDALIDTEVFRLWVPEDYGGIQTDVHTLLRAIELASYHDGATGWCVMIGATTALNAGRLPRHHAQTIYGDPRAVTGGFGRPAGEGRLTEDGGLVVTGRWQWGSGTGSTDYIVNEAFVPEGRWASLVAPEPLIEAPLYRFSLLGALAVGVAAVSIGLAARAVDELVALGEKVPDASSRSLAERATVQAELAQADADVRSSRAFIDEVVARCWDSAVEGRIEDEDKRLLRLAANNAVERSAAAVDRCYRAGGGTAVYHSSPLQRVFRDVHVATQHAMTAPRMMEPLGRMLFGLPTSTAQF